MDPEVQGEINNLKAAMRGVANVLVMLEHYAAGVQPSPEGLKRLREFVAEVDRAVNPGGIRGQMTL
jgi:hypothetical protein